MKNLISKLPIHGSEGTLTLIVCVGFLILGISSGGSLFSQQGLLSFLAYLSVPILIGLSQMTVLAVGQLNLAIGAMGGAVCGLMAVLMADGAVPVWAALLIGLATATIIGAINGLLVIITGLHGFIVTLGTMTILLGVQFSLVRSFTIDAYSDSLKSFGRENIAGIPWLFLATIAVSILVYFFFSRSVAGRNLLATGGSEVAARLSGISNARSMILAYTVSGFLTGLAALATMASLTGINRSIGVDWLLPSFAAPIIAGVLLTGGSVAIYGTIIAACLLRIVDVARAQFLLDPSWTSFVIGAVVLSTVAISEYRKRRAASVMQKREGLAA
ncbi:ABC transporter permease [Arthrobacter sp. D1-17]